MTKETTHKILTSPFGRITPVSLEAGCGRVLVHKREPVRKKGPENDEKVVSWILRPTERESVGMVKETTYGLS